MNEEQRKQFEESCKPLMKYLAENFNPHVTVIVNSTECELVEGIQSFQTPEFIKG
jgi:2'-5' RNA ligase